MEKAFETVKPDKRLAAVCGLFCPACGLYIGTKEDPEKLKGIAERTQQPLEKVTCYGCRSDKRSFYCEHLCTMYKCAAEKGIDFCGACNEYPCESLKEFQAAMPHRIELWQAQERIKEAGYEQWYMEMLEHYSCPTCGTINSAYDMACWKCGATPGNAYVSKHKDEIIQQMAKKK
ncbi:MAG: DUF3795 domain-containing protein [Desulfotomaculaceae bacterium]|nr:DUF3795 domain-containing protein [Desulfotomaculaceae bacterium]